MGTAELGNVTDMSTSRQQLEKHTVRLRIHDGTGHSAERVTVAPFAGCSLA